MKYVCNICSWVYDEEETCVKWESVPEGFVWELRGVDRKYFSQNREYFAFFSVLIDESSFWR